MPRLTPIIFKIIKPYLLALITIVCVGLSALTAYAEDGYSKAARLSCEAVKGENLHWLKKRAIRKRVFVRLFKAYKPYRATDAKTLANQLPLCKD